MAFFHFSIDISWSTLIHLKNVWESVLKICQRHLPVLFSRGTESACWPRKARLSPVTQRIRIHHWNIWYIPSQFNHVNQDYVAFALLQMCVEQQLQIKAVVCFTEKSICYFGNTHDMYSVSKTTYTILWNLTLTFGNALNAFIIRIQVYIHSITGAYQKEQVSEKSDSTFHAHHCFLSGPFGHGCHSN